MISELIFIMISFIALACAFYKNISIINPIIIFIVFTMLYSIGLSLVSYDYDLSLQYLGEKNLIDNVFLTSACAIAAASVTFFMNLKSKRYDGKYSNLIAIRRIELYFFCNFFLWFICMYFANKYGWHAFTRSYSIENSLGYTIYAYLKYIYICMGLIFLYANKFQSRFKVGLIISLQIILMIFDGGRTTLFGFIVASYWIYESNHRVNLGKSFFIVISLISLLVSVRLLVLDDSFFESVIPVIKLESVYGGYSAFQSIAEIDLFHAPLLMGASYLLDPIVYLFPLGIREHYLFFNNFSENFSFNSKEIFAPAGGFFYIAEAYANFGVFGGILIGSFFGILLNLSSKYRNIYPTLIIPYIATFGAIFTKSIFANTFKLFVAYFLIFIILNKIFIKNET
jgi:hypothetical protein